MNVRTMLLASTLVTACVATAGCNSKNGQNGGNGKTTGPTGGDGQGGAAPGGEDGGSAVIPASIRIAHLSPDASAIDVCLLAEATGPESTGDSAATSIGPLLQERFSDANGLAYTEVTTYLEIPEGKYTLRFVPPNAANCDKALAGTKDVPDIELRRKNYYTVAAIGQGDVTGGAKPFTVALFEDDLGPAAGKARLRFIHASPDTGAVDVGLIDAQGTFVPLFSGVAFGEAGAQKGINAYITHEPLDNATLAARLAGQPNNLITVPSVNVRAEQVVTLFGIGDRSGQPQPHRILACQDKQPQPQGGGQQGSAELAACQLL